MVLAHARRMRRADSGLRGSLSGVPQSHVGNSGCLTCIKQVCTALVAGATAAAAALTKNTDSSEVAKNRKRAADAGKQLTQGLSEAAAGAVAGIITEAARSLLPKSLTREIQNEESTGR
jgi:hypothetical protein